MTITKLQRTVVDALEDIKAQDIRVFNTTGLSDLFDRVVVATATSNRQTRALASHVREKAKEKGFPIISVEGELDMTNADLLREAVEASRSETLVLDLSAVRFLDSMAISTLEGGQRRLATEYRSLVVVSPPTTPSAWTLRVAGIDREVVRESIDDALVVAIARHTAA